MIKENQMVTTTETIKIPTFQNKVTGVISTTIMIVAIISIIILVISIIKCNNKLRSLEKEKEKEKLELKEKIKVRIAVILAMIILLFLGASVGQIYEFKPIIYLYPEETTELSVTLGKPENITCSYPQYNNGWQVIAHPNGDLEDKNTGRKLYALYWEGKKGNKADLSEGFIVKSEDTISFLEEKLAILGLNEKESEEFIVYWLPKMQKNEYNLVKFTDREEIENDMPLEFSKQPDTVIRVRMQYKGSFKNKNKRTKIRNS